MIRVLKRDDYNPLGKGGCVFDSIRLFFCMSVCKQHHSKSYEWIVMLFLGRDRVVN